jgi:hypothetical protein
VSDEIHDTSRVDAFMAARRRAMMLHAVWRPMLAGAAGASLVIAAVWVTLPKIAYRDIEVPRIVMRDAVVPNIIAKDVEIDIPRIVAATPAPTNSAERAFEGTKGWSEAVIRGRILRPDHNGFVLMTDAGEQGFYPAKIGAGGKIEPNPSVRDVVTSFIGALARCNQLPTGAYACVALGHDGRETAIAQAPIGAAL